MTKVALYARYSSDNQRDASIEDQFRICRERAEREGWQVVDSYSDRSVSGASLIRPGIQALMADAQGRQFDLVLAESLDRISRDQEDIAGVYKRLTFADVRIVTLSEGDISELHIGLKGTMGALYLKDLADKTRRGLRGRVEDGKSGGGNSYGYRVVRKTGPDGEPVRGEREIEPAEARIVRRIFAEYADGKSPRVIAHELNAEGVEGPRAGSWGPSTIHGNAKRGTGILNNELYIGRIVWNRQRFLKDPETGKRVARPNPEEDWIVQDVPDLRIVEDDLWEKAKLRQKDNSERYARAEGNGLTETRRHRHLFSGLIKCAECGGGYSMVYRDMFGCSTVKNKGTCTNSTRISRKELESRVLHALREHLMQPSLFKEFCEEFTRAVNRGRMDAASELTAKRAELKKVEAQIEKMLQAIMDGFYSSSMKEKMTALEARKAELSRDLEQAKEPPPLLHPNMALLYRERIDDLFKALEDEQTYLEASEGIRSLVGRIVVSPAVGNRAELWLEGDLAAILSLAAGRKVPASAEDSKVLRSMSAGEAETFGQKRKNRPQGAVQADAPEVLTSLVAGAGFEPATFRL